MYSPVRNLLLFLLLTIPSVTLADEDVWDLSALVHEFSGISHAKLVFRETRSSAFTMTDLVITGSVEYRRPHYIERRTVSPIVERIVINRDYLSIEKAVHAGRKGDSMVQTGKYRIQSWPLLATAVNSLRAMLGGDTAPIRENFEVALQGSRADWRLDLVPTNPEIRRYFTWITLYGSGARIQKTISTRADGGQSTLDLSYRLLQSTNP